MSDNTPQQLLMNAKKAAEFVGISRRSWDRLKSAGKIPPAIRLGMTHMWRRSDLEKWVFLGCPNLDAFTKITAASGKPGR